MYTQQNMWCDDSVIRNHEPCAALHIILMLCICMLSVISRIQQRFLYLLIIWTTKITRSLLIYRIRRLKWRSTYRFRRLESIKRKQSEETQYCKLILQLCDGEKQRQHRPSLRNCGLKSEYSFSHFSFFSFHSEIWARSLLPPLRMIDKTFCISI